jgi:hypothetical protein
MSVISILCRSESAQGLKSRKLYVCRAIFLVMVSAFESWVIFEVKDERLTFRILLFPVCIPSLLTDAGVAICRMGEWD